MFRFLPLVVIIQVLCLYHAYRNRASQQWFWLILFFPLIGSIIYLYDHFYNRKNVEAISEGIKGVVNSNYRVEQLEKELQRTDSYANKIMLAQKYLELQRYKEAIPLFESCLQEPQQNKEDLYIALTEAYYHQQDYKKVVELGQKLENSKAVNKSTAKIYFAWALYHTANTDDAHRAFMDTDLRFSNYWHRLQFVDFLQKTEQLADAHALLTELQHEFDIMTPQERKRNKQVAKEVAQLLAQMS